MYDIANVFKSIGLIKKTMLYTKKPAFQWIGKEGIDAFAERVKLDIQMKNKRDTIINNSEKPRIFDNIFKYFIDVINKPASLSEVSTNFELEKNSNLINHLNNSVLKKKTFTIIVIFL